MKTETHMVLEPDGLIRHLPQAQGLLELILRSTKDLLDAATDGDDFHAKLMTQIAPYEATLGRIRIDLLDRFGDPADMENDELVVVQVSCDQLVH